MTLELFPRHALREPGAKRPEEMGAFLFRESPLRNDPRWARFLDALHPTAEHVWFGDAIITAGTATIISVGTTFCAEQVRFRYADAMKAALGAAVRVTSREPVHTPRSRTRAPEQNEVVP